ncbi:Techylectin-like protein, partial [Araneus ventricosus]
MKILLHKIDCSHHNWNICADSKIIAVLIGMQLDYRKYCCFRCEWDSRLSGNAISRRDQNGHLLSDMDVALHLLTSAKISFTKYMMLTKTMNPRRPGDCEEMLQTGHNKSGIYTIWPRSRVTEDKPLDVFCDMDTDGGGWTVLQRRGDFKRPLDYFNKDWESYKKGFGDIDKEFWL